LNADAQNTMQTSMVQKTSLSKAVRLATVDNFQVSGVPLTHRHMELTCYQQGEEAKVVIVSLVRSNQERRCGFLKTSNRINVLLRLVLLPKRLE
jgi:AAA domain